MNNKYEVIEKENTSKNTEIYTLINLETQEEYMCLLEKNEDKRTSKILIDEVANVYDVGEALFQYDLDLFPYLPNYMITIDMYRGYEDYYPGKGNCLFDTDEDFIKAYEEEEFRIANILNKGVQNGKNKI